mmetsp:Transcript_14326/g.33466  ORF Transcript_14326/g.33466 Transcript_14326/m.33466 type:complete len:204 (-) Transcript_14326:904-1515(-)
MRRIKFQGPPENCPSLSLAFLSLEEVSIITKCWGPLGVRLERESEVSLCAIQVLSVHLQPVAIIAQSSSMVGSKAKSSLEARLSRVPVFLLVVVVSLSTKLLHSATARLEISITRGRWGTPTAATPLSGRCCSCTPATSATAPWIVDIRCPSAILVLVIQPHFRGECIEINLSTSRTGSIGPTSAIAAGSRRFRCSSEQWRPC